MELRAIVYTEQEGKDLIMNLQNQGAYFSKISVVYAGDKVEELWEVLCIIEGIVNLDDQQ